MRLYSDLPTFPHPSRKGWLCHEAPGGGLNCWEGGHAPTINRRHIDGPLLVFSDGQLHWLTPWERLLLAIGLTDAARLQARRRPNLLTPFETDTILRLTNER